MSVVWDDHKMTFSDGTEQPLRTHIPATRMRSFPVKGLYIGIIVLALGGLLIGFGLGYTVGHDRTGAACSRYVHALFADHELTAAEDQQYREDKVTCLSR